MNIAVIGAAGFVGRYLMAYLAAAGHRAFGYDLHVPPDLGTTLTSEIARCDIAREAPAFPAGLDAAVYLAQYPGYRAFPANAGELFAVNVVGPLRAAEAAANAGATAFIYASTGTVYAPTFEPMAEDGPVRRDQPYAASKVHAEEALALVSNIRTCCVRLFGVFGRGQQTMLVPAIASRVQSCQPVTAQANPTDPADRDGLRISLTYVDDVCVVLEQLVRRLQAGAGTPPIINLASPQPTSIAQLARAIGRRLAIDPIIECIDNPRASDFIADTSRLQAIIPHEYVSLDDAIDRTIPAP